MATLRIVSRFAGCVLVLCLVLPTAALSSDAPVILRRVGDTYARLKSYRYVGENQMTIEIAGTKYRFTNSVEGAVAEMPEIPYVLFEGGKFEKLGGSGPARPHAGIAMPSPAVFDFDRLPERAQATKLIGEASITANGRLSPCYIIQIQWRHTPDQMEFIRDDAEKLWVDKASHMVLRVSFEKFNDGNVAHPHVVEHWVTTVRSYSLNAPLPLWARNAQKGWVKQAYALSARMVGKPAPEFTLKDLDGKSVSLDGALGRVVLLEFWDTYCAPCRREEPALEKLQKDWTPDKLALFRITEQDSQLVRSFLLVHHLHFAALVQGAKVEHEYQVEAVPTLVVINRAGNITTYNVGGMSEKALIAALNKAKT